MAEYLNGCLRASFILWLCVFLIACSDKSPKLSPLSDDAVILAFGDSLTYGTGADNSQKQSYPAVLQQYTNRTVVNSGIPGEVSQDGLIRLAEDLEEYQPDLVILCHGGNDLIRKLSHAELRNNLDQMITLVQSSGAELILIGVPNFSLTLSVPPLYAELAEKFMIPVELDIIPELERDPKLKSDTIHPNSDGYKRLALAVQELLVTSSAL
jgi:acyl-CoA thioesterase-1